MGDDTDPRIKFDLSDVPVHRRPKVWTDALNEFFYDYDFRLPADFVFGEFKGCYAGDLSIASITSDAMSVFRTKSHIARDPLDSYFVLLPSDSRIGLGQKGSETSVEDKHFSLVSTSETYTYIQNDTTLFNNLIIPGPLMRKHAPRVDDIVASKLGGHPLERMFFDFANALCLNFEGIGPDARAVLARQAVELLGLMLDGADETSHATPVQTAHFGRIRRIIERNFANPALDIETIARALKLSIRYIQAIAAANGTSISTMIRQRRILEARRLLMRRSVTRRSIGVIAYDVGFNDIPHFNRVFRRETGCTPSNYTPEHRDREG